MWTIQLLVSGCVSFDRYIVVENQPLTRPQAAVVVASDRLVLEDGRSIMFNELLFSLKEGEKMQIEIKPAEPDSNQIAVYFKKPVPSARNWKHGPELELPLTIHRIPAFERALLGQGTLQ